MTSRFLQAVTGGQILLFNGAMRTELYNRGIYINRCFDELNLLNPGAFHAYMEYQKSQGADLAHTKPPHMNPTKEQLGVLIREKKFKSD